VPLLVELDTGKKTHEFLSQPTTPKFELLGIPLESLTGYYHVLTMEIPEKINGAELTIVNAPGYVRKILVPQDLPEFRMVAYGDVRSQHDKHKMVVDRIAKEHPLVVLQTGHLVSSGPNLDLWEKYFEIEAPLMSGSYYFPVFGNHEWGGEGYFEAFFSTRNNYLNERTYWVDLGIVGMVVVDNYSVNWAEAEPLEWLETALSMLEDKPWLIFSSHHPIYTNSNHSPWAVGRTYIQPLLEKYGVDLVLAGHNHCYERFEVNGIPYIVTGGGGAPLYDFNDIPTEELDLVIDHASIHHHVSMDIKPDLMKVKVIASEDASVFEEFEVLQK